MIEQRKKKERPFAAVMIDRELLKRVGAYCLDK